MNNLKRIFLPLALLTFASPALAMEAKRDNFEEKQEEVKESWKYNPKELSPFDYLPVEIPFYILSFIDRPNWLNTILTCKQFAGVMLNDHLKEYQDYKEYYNDKIRQYSLEKKEEKILFDYFQQVTELYKALQQKLEKSTKEKHWHIEWIKAQQFGNIISKVFDLEYNEIINKNPIVFQELKNLFITAAPKFNSSVEYKPTNKRAFEVKHLNSSSSMSRGFW